MHVLFAWQGYVYIVIEPCAMHGFDAWKEVFADFGLRGSFFCFLITLKPRAE